jgi:hypothetical protein
VDNTNEINLGVIICMHCSEIIDTQATNKVVTYYGVCDNVACKTQLVHAEEPHTAFSGF